MQYLLFKGSLVQYDTGGQWWAETRTIKDFIIEESSPDYMALSAVCPFTLDTLIIVHYTQPIPHPTWGTIIQWQCYEADTYHIK